MDTTAVAEVFARLDPALWVVTASASGRRGGLLATFVSQASIVAEMPRVVVGLAKQHHTWELVEGSAAFALHLLGEEQTELGPVNATGEPPCGLDGSASRGGEGRLGGCWQGAGLRRGVLPGPLWAGLGCSSSGLL